MPWHLVLVGPSGAGKTSLLRGLAQYPGYYIEKNWTYRDRRPGESDDELVFVDRSRFEQERSAFLSTHSSHGPEYGVPFPDLLRSDEVSMRALPIEETTVFRKRAVGRILVCAVDCPDLSLVEQRLVERDPAIDGEQLQLRKSRIAREAMLAPLFADMIFMNIQPTVDEAAAELHSALRTKLEGEL